MQDKPFMWFDHPPRGPYFMVMIVVDDFWNLSIFSHWKSAKGGETFYKFGQITATTSKYK